MSARIRGKKLAFTLGSPGIPMWQDIKSYELASEDLDGPTFGEIAAGDAAYKLTGSANLSTETGSFWSYLWENAGKDVAFTLAPHGNTEPTEAQPHFIGTLNVGRKPSFGLEGNSDGSFDFEFEVIGQPVLDRGE